MNSNTIIRNGTIRDSEKTFSIYLKEDGEVFCSTLNSTFRIAKSYDEYTRMSVTHIEQMIFDEEQKGANNMFELYGSSGGR